MANLFKTIGELARCDGILIVACRDCGRGGVKSAVDVRCSVPERHIDSLRYKCTGCGSRHTLATAYLPATHQALEQAINGELDLRD